MSTEIIAADSVLSMKDARFQDPVKYAVCPNCKGSRTGCWHCNFWGTVRRDSAEARCVHALRHIGVVGICLNAHQCTKCGAIITVDSSD